MTKAEKQVLKRVYLELKEVKAYYWSMAQALEDKYPVCEAGSPERKEINECNSLVEKWSAKENVVKDLVKEFSKGQELKEFLGINYEDLAEIIERVNKHVDRQIENR